MRQHPLLTTKEVIKHYKIGNTKLWELRKAGKITAIKVGRAVRYDLADIKRYIEECRHTPPAL